MSVADLPSTAFPGPGDLPADRSAGWASLVDLLRSRALQTGERTACTFLVDGEEEGPSLTWAELDAQARALAVSLVRAGFQGERALLLFPPGLDFIAAFFGCLYAGVVAVPVYPPGSRRTLPRLQSIVRDAAPRIALTRSQDRARLTKLTSPLPELSALPWEATDLVPSDLAREWAPPGVGRRDLAFLQYTSGSTAAPKGVMVSHGNLLHNEEMIRQAFDQSEESVVVGWLPLYHDMGLIGNVLQPLYTGARCILMSPMAFLSRPARWLEAISRYRATTSGGPDFAYDLCVRGIAAEERTALDLSSWKVAFSGAEPVRAETLRRFSAAFAPCGFQPRAFYPCYGLAEATLFVSGGRPGEGARIETVSAAGLEEGRGAFAGAGEAGRDLVGCGGAWLGQEIAVVDPERRRRCAAGTVGEIWIAGPSVAQGYWGQPEATLRDFGARLSGEPGSGPFLRTGDLGFVEDGELFVTGRLKDLIILRGRNHYPQDIEATAERSHPALRPGCGAAFPVESDHQERLVVVWELDPHAVERGGEAAEAIRQAIAEEHQIQVHELVLVRAGTVPRTSSGKIRRRACRTEYLEGQLAALHRSGAPDAAVEILAVEEPSREELLTGPVEDGVRRLASWLCREAARVIRVPLSRVDPREPLTRLGLDSLAAAGLRQSILAGFGVDLGFASLLEGASAEELAREVVEQLAGADAVPALSPGRTGPESPLSGGQKALWFLHALAPDSAPYHIVTAARVRPALSAAAFARAVEQLAARHPSLRATFGLAGGEPRQRSDGPAPLLDFEDAEAASEEEILSRLTGEAYRGFDLERGPLLRIRVLRRSPDEDVVLVAMHHIVSDFTSMAVLARDLGALYAREESRPAPVLPALPAGYSDFVAWQEALLAGPAGERLWAYWTERLAGPLQVLDLPTDRPRPPFQTWRGDRCNLRLGRELSQALAALARSRDLTLVTVLLAAFETLLGRTSGQDDVLVGVPAAGRSRPEFADLVGYFVNPVTLRADLSGSPTFAELLARVRQAAVGAFEHQDLPFGLLAERLAPERDPGRSPIFQALFVWQQGRGPDEEALPAFALGEAGARLALGGLELESISLPERASQFDLSLRAGRVGEGLTLSLQYNTDLFDATTAQRALGHLETLLAALAADPGQSVHTAALLRDAERAQLFREWNDTAARLSGERLVHRAFEAQAARTPDREALVGAGRSWTWRELDRESSRLARHLLSLGLRPEGRVGLCLERSAGVVVALLAVLKAGGAYVPLDPAYPRERIALIAGDAAIELLVTEERLAPLFADLPAGRVLLDRDREAIERHGTESPAVAVPPDALAYILFTSGSTGRPKGVMVEHHHATAFFSGLDGFLGSVPGCFLAISSISFDISVLEIFWALSRGFRLVLPPAGVRDADGILAAVLEHGATHLQCTPTLASALVVSEKAPAALGRIEKLLIGGEALPPALAARLGELLSGEILNVYGPTETTVWAAGDRIEGDAITLGRPFANIDFHVVDRRGEPVPVGVPGELLIGGVGVSRGYFRRPELTAERFLPDPWSASAGSRLYRTGDLVRRLADGRLAFVGRTDHQVKVRGHRIELGEVEATLRDHPGVREAVVVAQRRRGQGDNDMRLAAFAVVAGPDAAELRRFLAGRLPDFMVPSSCVLLDALPLTPSGKVDRKALAQRETAPEAGSGPSRPPAGPVEEILLAVFRELLGSERLGVDDSFFDAGGHSLLAMQIVARVRSIFAVDLPVRAVFEHPTVERLAAAVERESAAGRPAWPPLERVPRDRPLPLSLPQQRLWLLDRIDPGNTVYNVPGVLRLRGRLDRATLAAALREVAGRHEILRTVFAGRDGEPVQVVHAAGPVPLPVVDLRALDGVRGEAAARVLTREAAALPFDLERGPLWRCALLALGEDDHVLLLGLHHIVSDGWSLGVLAREVGSLYEAFRRSLPSPLPELPVQYGDYACWQRRWLTGEVLAPQLAAWRTRLAALPGLELPADRPRPSVQRFRGAAVSRRLPARLSRDLAAVARRHGATPLMALLGGFLSLLARATGQDDVRVGMPVAGRRHPATEGLIGFFVNTVVVRADLGGDPDFLAVLGRVRESALAASAQQDLPFERLVEELAPQRDPGRTPLFQIAFAPQPALDPAAIFPSLDAGLWPNGDAVARFDLTVFVTEEAEGSLLSFNHATDLYDATTIARLAGSLEELLAAAAGDPARPLSSLPVLSEAQRHEILVEWNDTEQSAGAPWRSIHRFFAAQTASGPDAPALVWKDGSMSYGELNERSNRLARLLRFRGVAPEEPVGVLLERSPEMIVAFLAVLKAGGAYVPLDPAAPRERLTLMAEEAGVCLVIGEERFGGSLPEIGVCATVLLDRDHEAVSAQAGGDLDGWSEPGGLAYVLFTSGSTGRPKAVGVEHRSVLRLVRETGFADFGRDRVFLQLAPASFDAATLEIWGPLLNGAALALAEPGVVALPELARTLERHRVSTLWLTAGLFHQMVEERLAALRPVRQLLAGGDVLSPVHVNRVLAELPGCELINGYGPTENTTFTCCHAVREPVAAGASVPIGRPIAGTRAHVLDRWLQAAPVGVPGELFTGGEGIARGYLGWPELTAERFVPDPFAGFLSEPGSRLYRTGDLVRLRPDGTIEFLGRLDSQVKIRGFRVEPGEVEAALARHPAVEQAVVVAGRGLAGEIRLIAYLVAAGEAAPGSAELRAFLKGILPEHMVPAAWVFLPELPLTPNGKVDRRALPEPAAATGEETSAAPLTAVEELLAELWAGRLGVERVGRDDDFFALGGHSLAATQLAAAIGDAFEIELAPRCLFEAPTVGGLAEAVERAIRDSEHPPAPPLERGPRGGALPLSFAQRRLWFLARLEPESPAYNIPAAVRLTGALDPAALAASVHEIARRHEVLRARFAVVAGEPVQIVDPEARPAWTMVDLRGLPAPARRRESARVAQEEAERPFDLSRGPLLRAILFALDGSRDAAEHLLVLNLHHAAGDARSLEVLVRELRELYTAFSQRRPSPLPELPVQYADFARWQRSWLTGDLLSAELRHWTETLAGSPPRLALPADRQPPAVPSGRGGSWSAVLPVSLAGDVRRLARELRATPFMVLLAAFAGLAHRLSGQDDLVLGSTVANRGRRELEDLIGFFVNTLALRVDASGDPAGSELVARTRRVALDAYVHQDLPFEELVAALQPERVPSRAPLVQVLIQLVPATFDLRLPDLDVSLLELDTRTAKLDLVVNFFTDGETLRAVWRYRTDVFEGPTIRRFAACLEACLTGFVADPAQRVGDLPLLGAAERQQLLADWNDTDAAFPPGSFQELFAARVRETPDAPAVLCGEEILTYAGLAARAARLGGGLLAAGVGPEEVVAVCAERGPDLLAAMLGIWQAGAVYLPIDPHHPWRRTTEILEQSGSRFALVSRQLAETVWEKGETAGLPACLRVLPLEDLVSGAQEPAPGRHPLPGQLAYVIFTSGSTGRPKGAMVEHAGMLNHLWAKVADLGLTGSDCVAQTASQTFDISVWQLLAALLVGGSVRVFPDSIVRDPARLLAEVEEHGVTVLEIVPSFLVALLSRPDARPLPGLRWLIPTGEALQPELCRRWFESYPDVPLVNAYGPTECSDDVTHQVLRAPLPEGTAQTPIGRPVANTAVYLLSRGLLPVPAGVAGELCVGGVQVGRGYLGRPELTAERFVPDPLSAAPGGRLYRTGDLARHRRTGEVEFLGRIDHQVKIRGFRIELGEIEAVLARHPEVAEAVVVARQEKAGARLVAYLVPRQDRPGLVSELRAALLERLPEHMVPGTFVVLAALPLTPNGKVDRKALPAPEQGTERPADRVAPRTGIERFLAGLFCQALGIEEVWIEESFFELGGNSISGATLINRVQEELREIVHVVALFDHPTVAKLAAYLEIDYPEAVARIWGEESARREARSGLRIGADQVARLRQAIAPLPPLSDPAAGKNPSAVFVLSAPRSGSTLLRVMLAGHPRLFAPPELELLSFNTMPERKAAFSGRDSFWLEGLLRAIMSIRGCGPEEARQVVEQAERDGWTTRQVYREMQTWLGSRILVDKSPAYALDLAVLQRAEEIFSEPRYIHLVRHPRAAIRSFEEARLDQVFFRHPHEFGRRELAELIWTISHQNIAEFLGGVPRERQHWVRFEDLVERPERALRGLCDWLGFDYHEAMARPYEEKSSRMTDGLHAASRMLGDVKFHQHAGVDPEVGRRWRKQAGETPLGEPAWETAVLLGYERESSAWSPIEPVERVPGACLPLSFAQQRLWFLDQMEPGSPLYNIPLAVRIEGSLAPAVLARALAEVVRRHETLRTTFPMISGEGAQIVAADARCELPVVDLRGLPAPAADAETERLIRREALRPFDLARGPLLRATLVARSDREHLALLTLHHIVSDGWSMGVLLRELGALYAAFREGLPTPLPELPIQYADFALWQRGRLTGPLLAAELAWWRERLQDAPPGLELPTDRPRRAVPSSRGASLRFRLPAGLTRGLAALSQSRRTTLFMTLLAAFQVLLSRYSGQRDLCVGTPIAGRNHIQTEGLIGFLVNTLVLRTDLGGDPRFGDLLARVRATTLGAYAHQDLPFERLVSELQPERSLSRTPLFQVIFGLQNTRPADLRLDGLCLSVLEPVVETAKFELNLALAEQGAELAGALEYRSDLFDEATALHLLAHFQTLLAGIVADPELPVGSLPLLTAAERHEILCEPQAGRAVCPASSLAGLFAAQVRTRPDAVALVCEGESLSYGELDARANRLARRLRDLGVRGEDRVGLCTERSLDLIVGLLAILKAGGAYVPVDPAYPEARILYLLADAGLAALLTRRSLLPRLPELPVPVVEIERAGEGPADPLPVAIDPAQLAYVIYTSGSTGRPKGVGVTHANVLRLLAATEPRFGFGPEDVWTLFHSSAFDFSVWEIWGALAYGGRLVVVPYWVSRSPAAFHGLLAREQVTVLNQTPSAFRQLIQADGEAPGEDLALRWVVFGGEALDIQSLRPWFERHGDRRPTLVNMYGITETTVHVTFRSLGESDLRRPASVIGAPIADLRVYVLDERMEPQPFGVPGEMYVGGAGVARGYLGRPELAAERFVPDPFDAAPGSRLYRSGDLARRLPSGDLEYLGRIDHQVKIRGFRIELGEIEAALAGHPAVACSIVLAREGSAGEKRLVAYVVPRPGEPLSVLGLRAFLTERLPEHMLPAAFVPLASLPMTAHGKIDRAALPEPDQGAVQAELAYTPPRTPAEIALAQAWTEVLGIERAGTEDNFFSLGGDSILSIRVLARARELGYDCSLQQIFQHQTLGELAREARAVVTGGPRAAAAEPFSLLSAADRAAMPEGVEDAYPLARLQAGMLFHSEFHPERAVYHDIFGAFLEAPFSAEHLRRAIALVAERHPVLRTSFDLSGFSEPLQLVQRTVEIDLTVGDLRGLAPAEQERFLADWVTEEKARPFAWGRPPLAHFSVHRRSEESFQFSFGFHHAILDGWSLSVLLNELFRSYLALLAGREPEIAPPPASFRDFVALEIAATASEESRGYWTGQLADAPATTLPRWQARRPREGAAESNAGTRTALSPDLSEDLLRLSRDLGLPLKTLLLAAHCRVLALFSGQPEVMTGLVANGRPETAGGELALGLFLNTLPFRLASGGGSWRELAERTFAAERELLTHRRFPLAELQPGGQPLFEAVFNFVHFHLYQGLLEFDEIRYLGGELFEETNFAFVASFNQDPAMGRITLRLEYSPQEFPASQVRQIADAYHRALAALAAHPEAAVDETPLLGAAERQQLLLEWNDTGVDCAQEPLVHELFARYAALQPLAPAVCSQQGVLTYGELDRRSNRLAHHLRRLGVGPETLVALCTDRTPDRVVGIVAVLKAGGAYVSLDPGYPRERLAFLLDDAGAPVVLTEEKHAAALPPCAARVLRLDADWNTVEGEDERPPVTGVGPENLSYVVYTSGSTGRPKGVEIPHSGLMNLVRWHQRLYGVEPQDRGTQVASPAFDASIWELWPYLAGGASVCIPEEEIRLSAPGMLRWWSEEGITLAYLMTPLAEGVLEEGYVEGLDLKVRALIIGGDRLHRGPDPRVGFRLMNHYGPAEYTVTSTVVEVPAAGEGRGIPTIGRAIDNTQIYVLDPQGQPVPVGVAGELYVAGTGLARGYLRRADLTAEKFVPNPWSAEPGARMYRTADLVRYLPDGDLDFLGRLDHQVKLRGLRIELGEIETVLGQHPGVREAAVMVREDRPGQKRLTAYVVATGEPAPAKEELRDLLQEHLPAYMVPSAFVELPALPLTPNGKVDRRALPRPEIDREESCEPPRNETEEKLAALWRDMLGLDRIGIHDTFFELGGNSLLATRMVSRIRGDFRIELPLRRLFERPTIAGLAEVIAEEEKASDPLQKIAEALARIDQLSPAQIQLLLEERLQ